MNKKLYSYLFGLFGTDGNVKRTSDNNHISSLVLELIDQDIIEKIANILPDCSISERTRNTNFKKNYHSYILYCHNKEFLSWCEENNFPLQDKTNIINIPKEYEEKDFWRGIIDGDGSLGMKTIEEQPFINLTTKSEFLKEAYCDFIYKTTNFRPKCNRNKRDNIYNITLHGEKAIKILKTIYEDADIYINRKYNTYLSLLSWKKKERKGIIKKPWSLEEEKDLLTLSQEDFIIKYPNRTLVAIKAKKRRLKGGGSNVNK